MKLYEFKFEGAKCSGCNWEVSRLYVLSESRRVAIHLLRIGDAGLCSSCICDLLSEKKYRIYPPSEKVGI